MNTTGRRTETRLKVELDALKLALQKRQEEVTVIMTEASMTYTF